MLDAVIELAAGNESAIVVDPRWWTVIAGSMDFESFSGVHCLEAGGGRILLTLYGSPDSADVAFTFVGLELQSLCRIPPIVQGDDGPLDQKRAELRRIRDGLDRRLQERSFGSAVTTLRAATR